MKPSHHSCQAVVEFAVTLPILLLLMIGLINLGILIQAQLVMTHATWEGARTGSTLDRSKGEGDTEIFGAVKAGMSGLDPDLVGIIVLPDEAQRNSMPWPGPRGQSLTIQTVYSLSMGLPFPMTIPIKSQATCRIEYQNPS